MFMKAKLRRVGLNELLGGAVIETRRSIYYAQALAQLAANDLPSSSKTSHTTCTEKFYLHQKFSLDTIWRHNRDKQHHRAKESSQAPAKVILR
jgi:hypothetical protein